MDRFFVRKTSLGMSGLLANRPIVQMAVLALLVTTTSAHAQDPSTRHPSQANDASLTASRDPFQKGSVGVEIGASPLWEVWNINEEHEQVIEGTAAFWGAIRNRIAVGIEFNHALVIQDAPGPFVQGLSGMVRFKLTDRPTWN